MTVWTNVCLEEVNDWLATRDLGLAKNIAPIEEGVEDSIFRLSMADGDTLCLRIFERTEPVGPLTIASLLASHGLPTCPPVEDKQGRLFFPLKNKPAAVYRWINGKWVEKPSLAQIETIGKFLGRAAKIGIEHCGEWKRENPRGWKWFAETTQELVAVLDKDTARELQSEVSAQADFWMNEPKEIHKGPIHADIFRNNVLFYPSGEFAAVIDWGFCASDFPLIFDLAIAANDWCLSDNSPQLDAARIQALMRGRYGELPLTKEEEKAWPMALRWAALRFYLSRLYDWKLPRAEGKKHDPNHFLKIMRARQKS